IPGSRVAPGDVFVVSPSGVEARAGGSKAVTAEPRQDRERSFDPSVRLRDVPMSCADWNPRQEASDWEPLALRDRVAANVSGVDLQQAAPLFSWFLELCDPPEGMTYLSIDRGSDGLQVLLGDERPPSR